MISFTCSGCGKTLHVRDELAGRKVKCSACGVGVAVPAPVVAVASPADEPADVIPVGPQTADISSALARLFLGAVKGVLLPPLLLVLLALDIGLNAMLGINSSRSRDSFVGSFVPRGAGLRWAFVGLVAVLSIVLGVFAGNALAGGLGIVVGVVVCYLLGTMSAGAFMELLKPPVPTRT